MARAGWISSPQFAALILVHLCCCCFFPGIRSHEVEEPMPNPLHLGKLKVTHLHFFLHDTISTANATSIKVAGPRGRPRPFSFGDVYVLDDILTEGVDPSSKLVGNAQGIFAFSGKRKVSLFMALDFEFTDGEFNGSSISVSSRNPISETRREVPVVGGRGRFRLAQGFALLNTRYLNLTTLDAIVEYNVTVLHY